uniref:Tudor domain-containing protein n=1 Tax=Cacopsylla melanoneura TaxID=428564 RepID=A0A8D9BDQ9_9HEMI
MSTQEAIQHVDLRDQMRKQFSNTEVDFFHINYNLKMIDIKQLDRIYFQTSALPYYKSQMKKSTGSKSSDVTSPLPRSHQTSSSDVTASLPPSHQTSSGKSCHTRNSSNFEENSIKSPSSHSGRNGYRSIPQSPQDGHSRQYDDPDDRLTPGCIATIKQLNDQAPIEANIVCIQGNVNICLKSPSVPTPTTPLSNQYKISSRVNVTVNSPLTVLMLAKEGDIQWVQDKEFVNIYADWHEAIESNITEFKQTPQCGEYCLKNFDYVWCRAIVTKETPLTICYIDYGNEEVVTNPRDLKPMPDMCLSYPPFRFQIKWVKQNNTHISFDYEQEVTIIPVEVLGENCFKVLKEGESLKPNIKYKDKPISRCGDNLVMNKPIEVHVQNKTNAVLVGTTSTNNDEYNNISIQATVDKSNDISYDDIEQDDFVLILDSDSKQWHRAQLVNQEESIFYLIDLGRSCESPKHLKSLFNNMWNLPPRYLYFKINKSLLKLCPVNSVIEVLPLEISNDNIIVCQLVSSPLFALESPLPLILNKEYTAYFANTDSVDKTVSYFFMDRDHFGSSIFNFHQLIESSNLLSKVDVGDYCGIPQEGEVLCRAKVLKVSGDNVTVFVLDLGEVDIVSITDCRELPVGVYAEPPCIIKTNPLDSVSHLESQLKVTIIPRKEISRRYYSVNIVG